MSSRHSAAWFEQYRTSHATALGLDPATATDEQISTARNAQYRRENCIRLGLDPDTATDQQIAERQFGLTQPPAGGQPATLDPATATEEQLKAAQLGQLNQPPASAQPAANEGQRSDQTD